MGRTYLEEGLGDEDILKGGDGGANTMKRRGQLSRSPLCTMLAPRRGRRRVHLVVSSNFGPRSFFPTRS